jgi:hypothetical protein
MHRERQIKFGSTDDPRPSVDARFWAKVDKSEGCWLWTAGKSHDGYAKFYPVAGEPVYAHRWSYEHRVGPIPGGMQLDHRCHNRDATCSGGATCLHRACVNPDHLEPVTGRENQHRSPHTFAGRARCPKGHPYVGSNLAHNAAGRVCLTCKADRKRRRS